MMERLLTNERDFNSHPLTMDPLDRNIPTNYTYKKYEQIGSGSFGTVWKGICEQTEEIVAIKEVYQDMRYKNRELQILQELNHPNIIKMKQFYYTTVERNKTEKYLNVVMTYIPESLSQVIRHSFRKIKTLDVKLIKLYAYQMIRGLNYLNAIGICHRDIKPQNILVDHTNNILQLCDFGSAKKLRLNEQNVSYICSRYYRAPELIFNATEYTNAIDMWSVGCVICEMGLGQPIFPGETSIDQLFEIIKVLGTPSKNQIISMNRDYVKYKFPLIKCFTLREVFKQHLQELGQDFINLITKIFVYEPNKRIKAIDALCHPFFDEIRNDQTMDQILMTALFNYTEEERLMDTDNKIESILIPKWYKA